LILFAPERVDFIHPHPLTGCFFLFPKIVLQTRSLPHRALRLNFAATMYSKAMSNNSEQKLQDELYVVGGKNY